MKHYFRLMLLVCAAVLTSACHGGGENNPDDPKGEVQENFAVVSCSVAPAQEVNHILQVITIGFSGPLQVTSKASAKLNGQSVPVAKTAGSTSSVDITVSLEEATDYTLVLEAGSVVSMKDSLRVNPRYEVAFRTNKTSADGLPDNDAMALTRRMGFGWNLGNHFDTSSSRDGLTKPQWGYWDHQAQPTEALYQALAAAGVGTVRICVTWGDYQSTDGEYTIPTSYMEEVAQNVEWAKNAGLMVIINTHHDEYWQDIAGAATSNIINDKVKERFEKTWTQIANRFKDEGDYLIMEGINEVHNTATNDWTGNASQYAILNEWNQLIVNTIRATGSQNATRWIGVAGYAANPSITMRSLVLPNDPANKLAVAIHCYDPYDFTLRDPLTNSWGTAAQKRQINDLLQQVRRTYIDNNIACYLGEFGCSRHDSEAANACRKLYLEYFCRAAHFAGLSASLWDNYNYGSGPEHHAYFDHNDGSFVDDGAELIPMMVRAITSTDPEYTLESIQ